jgi:hypothetical protein
MTQRVIDGATVMVHGYEFQASNVLWFDERDQMTGKPTGRRAVSFTGTCTTNPLNDGIRHTGYNGGKYGGNELSGYIE